MNILPLTDLGRVSAIHPRIDKVPLGQHEEVSAVNAGIFNANPPTPKYLFFLGRQCDIRIHQILRR